MRSAIKFPFPRRHRPRPSIPNIRSVLQLLNHVTRSCSSSSSSSTAPLPPSSPFDPETYLHHARQKFGSQPPTLIPDNLSPTNSRLLTLSLADHVPSLFPWRPTHDPSPSQSQSGGMPLPQGHHLVYFPLQLPPSRLMPDGTDPAHWPGAPFSRRMWAGGGVVFRDGWEGAMRLDGRPVVCEEVVGPEPVMKGREAGGEKVFVEVRRAYGAAGDRREGAVIEELRRLVFMREKETGGEGGKGGDKGGGRVVRASAVPEFTFPLRPDATLLFHFSALTYNAHAIHIDPDYARNREGYKGLLVHGPLTLVLMLSALNASLVRLRSGLPKSTLSETARTPYVKSLNYRNLAPLYVDEDMKVCLRRNKPEGDELGWDVWVEGPEGGLAVKGHAVTTGISTR